MIVLILIVMVLTGCSQGKEEWTSRRVISSIVSGGAVGDEWEAEDEEDEDEDEDEYMPWNPYLPGREKKYDWYDDITSGTFQGEFDFGSRVSEKVMFVYETMGEGLCQISIQTKAEEIAEEIPVEMLNLGEFYIEPDAITKVSDGWRDISEDQLSDLMEKGKKPDHSVVVCQESALADDKTDGHGIHIRREIRGEDVVCYLYDNFVPNGKYQMYVWKKNAGLVAYRCGYGGQGDCIRIWSEDISGDASYLKESFYVPGNNAQEKASPVVSNPYFPYRDGDIVPLTFVSEVFEKQRGTVRLRVKNLDNSEKGSLYRLTYNRVSGIAMKDSEDEIQSGLIEFIKKQGNDMGYYWVTQEKIWYVACLSPDQKKTLLQKGTLPECGEVICQEKPKADKEKEGKVLVDHAWIERHKGGICCYRSYRTNGSGDTRAVCQYVWKKNVGLVGYRTFYDMCNQTFAIYQKKYLTVKDDVFEIDWKK